MRKLLRRLPQPLLDRMLAARKRYRSARYRARERLRPVRLGRAEIETALRAAGLGEADAVFVQAGMSSFGTIEGGPGAVIDALDAVLGADGLIAMPAFPLGRPAIEQLREQPVFDLRDTPSRMGAVSELFRTSAGTLRSLHPTHSMCARGPGAAAIVSGHELAETPFGAGTPFEKLIERGATQVFFGSGVRAITMYHAWECLREPRYPIDVFWPQRIDARCIDAEGGEHVVSTLVHDPRVFPGRVDSDPKLERRVRDRLVEGGMHSVTVGRGEVLAQPLPEMLATFEQMLAEGLTIYRPQLLAEARVA
jgi:aminoglycoside 3-N-acetyltransferase